MWAVYLVFMVLAVVRAAKLQYCQELVLKGSALRKDVTTMVFTMDGTCVMCYREIRKLVRLKTQMARLGHKADILVALDRLPQDHEHELPSEVTVDLEDAWTKLGQLNGHIFVFDKCGKLAYQVITPWSRQMYPFTAMAGLSALYDAPCIDCNVTSQAISELQNQLLLDKSKQSQRNQSDEVLGDFDRMELQENKLPLTINIRQRHEDIVKGTGVTYDVVELETDHPNYHGRENATHASEPVNSVSTTSENNPYVTNVRKNETQTEDSTRYTSQGKNGTSDISQEGNSVVNTTETSKEPPANQQEYTELLKRYQPLMKWRACANLVMSVKL